MSIRKASSGFKVPGSRFRVQGSGSKTDACSFAKNNSKLGTRNPVRRKSAGLSLVELIVFIVVVSAAVAGVLAAFNVSTRASADPMIQKQVLAIAEALLEEVQLQPFTYCDPDDPNAATANGVGDCTTAEGIGPEGGENRSAGPLLFDNVSDYMVGGGLTINPISDISGTVITGLDGYSATITVANQSLGPGGAPPTNIPGAESLLITVTVTHPSLTLGVVLNGYRTRYAPNALP